MNNNNFFNAAYSNDRNTWKMADGGLDDQEAQQHSSAPYIIQIFNNSDIAVQNVDIGDSFTNRVGTPGVEWNFNLPAGVTVTSTISGVTYQEFLAQSESQPFTVAKTMIVSTAAGQLDQTVAITHRNASGDRNDHVITPTLDPYQQQTDRIIDEYEYLFDGMTRLRFNEIASSATVTVRMYLKNKYAASQIISGRPALQDYSAPNLIKIG